MKKTVLITGGSGSLGRDLIRSWAGRDDLNVVLLVHRSVPEGLTYDRPRVHLVWGDVGKPGLGLKPEVASRLATVVTHVLHSAALTRFDADWSEAYHCNVLGTYNTLEFARTCRNLHHFGHVSTAFVSGKREGIVGEAELEHTAGFTNNYERSKHLAERLINTSSGEIPIGIYRPSIVFGDSVTGRVGAVQASHRTIRLMYLTGPESMPGRPDYVVDLVPSDVVANTLSTLLLDRPEPGVYHLTSGPEKSLTLDRFFESVYEHCARLNPEWRLRGYQAPAIVPSKTLFGEGNPTQGRRRDVFTLTRHFAAQLDHPKVYDQSNLFRCFPEYETLLPHCRDYLPKVIGYLIRTNWCRRAA